jgi:hypothetical protein
MLVRKLLALFKYITKRNFAYLMGIVHTERLCISFLQPLGTDIFFFYFSKSISDLTFILEIFWHWQLFSIRFRYEEKSNQKINEKIREKIDLLIKKTYRYR